MGELAGLLRRAGVTRGELAGLAVSPDGTTAVAAPAAMATTAQPATKQAATARAATTQAATTQWITSAEEIAAADADLRPRWVTWSGESAARLTGQGVRLATCWDITAVHRLLSGGWHADPGLVWASLHGLPLDGVPSRAPGELFSASAGLHGLAASLPASQEQAAAEDDPVGADGYLRPEWTDGGWADTPQRLARWARLALEVARLQASALGAGPRHAARMATAHSESTAELLCAELAADGLPVSRAAAEELLAQIIGPRPRSAAEEARTRAARDEQVLRHAPRALATQSLAATGLRNPQHVRDLLRAAGIDVPDTRAWRLEQYRDSHPLVAALLEWRKAERIATTYGYAWLDACLGPDGRLRGSWTGSDGAAGRMTASAGLHNMPAILRRAVIAQDGHVLVRADLGQIEPRVLAAVSGDRALIAATEADDLYLPVARALNVDRPTAKVAMIAAMYGQTTGHGGQAARRMKAAYPVAMGYLDEADRRARAGQDLRTYGGRLVRMSSGDTASRNKASEADGASGASGGGEPSGRAAARGRYGRNAVIQGAAAELFKMWAVTVRARGAAAGARIVLCLHDELLVHVPEERADATARLVAGCLAETARRWTPGPGIHFPADIAIVRCWADAKDAKDAKPGAKPDGTAGGKADTVTANTSGQEGA
jgi:DNA polymerase-1